MKILIVDDEFVSRKKAHKILSSYGECDIAFNGEEALGAFRAAHEEGHPYSLITMDIKMPDMDGIEALKKDSGLGRFPGYPTWKRRQSGHVDGEHGL